MHLLRFQHILIQRGGRRCSEDQGVAAPVQHATAQHPERLRKFVLLRQAGYRRGQSGKKYPVTHFIHTPPSIKHSMSSQTLHGALLRNGLQTVPHWNCNVFFRVDLRTADGYDTARVTVFRGISRHAPLGRLFSRLDTSSATVCRKWKAALASESSI